VTFRHLRYFAAVAGVGSFARAAKQLHVAQPALSRQIRALEAEIGVGLFERGRRGVALTPAGTALLSAVRALGDRLVLLVLRTQLARDGMRGRLRIGLARSALESSSIGGAIATLQEAYPEIDLAVSEITPFSQARQLREGALDIAVAVQQENEEPGIRREVLFEELVDCAILPRDHALSRAVSVSAEQLRDLPLVTIAESRASGLTRVYKALRAISTVHEHETVESVFGLVAAGRGWTIGPRFFRRNPPAGTAVLTLRDVRIKIEVALHWRADDTSLLVANALAVLRSAGTSRDATDSMRRKRARETARAPNRTLTTVAHAVELPPLRGLVATLETGSFSAAAEGLGLTQSAVSRQVRSLERALGCRLLERDGNGVRPTRAGDVLRTEADDVLKLASDAVEACRRVAHGRMGTCRIGTLPSELTDGLVKSALNVMADRVPGVTVELLEMISPLQVTALRERHIDVGIAGGYAGLVDGADIDSVPLSEDPLECALVSRSHLFASRASLTPADLSGEPFLFGSREVAPRAYDIVMRTLEDCGVAPRIHASVDGARALWKLASDGAGWTIGLRSQRCFPPPGLVAIPVDGLSIAWGVWLLWRHGETRRSVLDVISVFRESAGIVETRR
jgi:DNA-binding transcriptional LysR family regulator